MKTSRTMAPVATLDYMTDVLHGLNVRHYNYLAVEPAPAVTYRVIVSTQIYENYGAHCWNGEGECPQYWKAKGGNDFIVAENLSERDMLTTDAHSYVPDGIERNSVGYQEFIRCVCFLPSNVPTHDEQMIADFAAWGQPLRPAEVAAMLQEQKRFLKT